MWKVNGNGSQPLPGENYICITVWHFKIYSAYSYENCLAAQSFLSNGSCFHATIWRQKSLQNCAPHRQGGHEKSKAHKTILADLDGKCATKRPKSHHPTPPQYTTCLGILKTTLQKIQIQFRMGSTDFLFTAQVNKVTRFIHFGIPIPSHSCNQQPRNVWITSELGRKHFSICSRNNVRISCEYTLQVNCSKYPVQRERICSILSKKKPKVRSRTWNDCTWGCEITLCK